LSASAYAEVNPLQQAIDEAADGAVIILEKGLYKGNIVVNKSVTIDGKDGGAVIYGDGKGTVITVNASFVTLQNLSIMNSGSLHDSIDSCIAVRKSNVVKIQDNKLSDCLFGVNLEQVNRSMVERNEISSKKMDLGLRGDGIRLWYSHSNLIRNNDLHDVRDVVFWYSSANEIAGNFVTRSRYSLHFMYADRNVVTGNVFDGNSVGAFFMFSHSSRVMDNEMLNATGAFGIGIGLKECSDFLISGNTVLYNARGYYLDQSPYQPGMTNKYTANNIMYNTVGIQFHGTQLASTFEENIFKGNIADISNDTPESRMDLNNWYMNSWDVYEGFDFNKDNFGDTPMISAEYADKMMNYQPAVKFFYGAPVISLLDFLSRLLPFSEPEILAVDSKPVVREVGGEGS
jgi:nitrous oxidase accessory protein